MTSLIQTLLGLVEKAAEKSEIVPKGPFPLVNIGENLALLARNTAKEELDKRWHNSTK